jgi:uncharacterized protein (TIGR02594 family)
VTENVLHSTKISQKSAPNLRFLEGFSVFWHFVEALQHFFSSLLDYYAREWPVRANPLIVGFFAATDYGMPSGDTTAWCAAFINWVLERSANDKTVVPMPTRSAASKSFRNWGQVTSGKTQATSGETELRPRKGDIAVFRNTTGNTNHGHVAFFVEFNASRTHLLILGGNQLPKDKNNTGEINMKWFPVEGKTQVLDSIRTADWLHEG